MDIVIEKRLVRCLVTHLKKIKNKKVDDWGEKN
jgi:hypothetical protein